MAAMSCQEAGEAKEEALLPLEDGESTNGHLGPPECLKDTKPSVTKMAFSVNLQLAPESLDPHTLRLLWGQRELEIQALRFAIQNHQNAQHGHILQVSGFPLRSSRSQERLLQTQVHKLTLELKEQKEQAQLEKVHLEEQLLQARSLLQQQEAELQALHGSCLLQLAHSSWVGRMLKSSTGSVEVVTVETLMDPSDPSENDEAPPAQEGFRLEDVDWNTIAHRYPNLLTNIKSNSDYKHTWPQRPSLLPPTPPPDEDECDSELRKRHLEHRLKNVEWSSLPLVGTSSSGFAGDSDSSSCLLDNRFDKQVMGHPPQRPGHVSFEQIESQVRSFSRNSKSESEGHCRPVDLTGDVPSEHSIRGTPSGTGLHSPDLWETHSDGPGKTVLVRDSCADSDHWRPSHPLSRTGSCLKIVAVNLRERFVRILNESMEETADLGGFTLQQLVRSFPMFSYRFPPHTLLAPQHHVTVRPCRQVRGEEPGSIKQPPPPFVGREPVHFHSSWSFVTLLLNPKGEVFSKHQVPHLVTPTPRIFDNTNLSIDRFPLSEAQPREQLCSPRLPPSGRGRRAQVQTRRPGWGPQDPGSPPPHQAPPLEPSHGLRVLLPRLVTSKLFRPRDVPAPPESSETDTRELLPTIPQDELSLSDHQANKEYRDRVCRKSVDRSCPVVALSVQSMTERRFGFRLFSCPPITEDARRRV